MQTVISLLTFNQLTTVIKFILEINIYQDQTIKELEDQMKMIISQISQFFAHMQSNRIHFQVLFVCDDMITY